MADAEYVPFLQTYFPRLGLRWQGFRNVRKQVVKRIKRRLNELNLDSLAAYAGYLEHHPEEWLILDGFCRITISRFYRDQAVFDVLRTDVLPGLAQRALHQHEHELRCWCAGCASGEEAYTLSLLWHVCLASAFRTLRFRIVATDVDQHMLERARRGQYGLNSLRELPPGWIALGFEHHDHCYEVRKVYREAVCFLEQDIRQEMPAGSFHLIMCRNLVFTYFAEPLQQEIVTQIGKRLIAGGILVVGKHESLPQDREPFVAYTGQQSIFQKRCTA
jgi:chemotaxis protein methyltransferase CheR